MKDETAHTSTLRLEWKRREGGGGRTQRDYLDCVIDGRPLSEAVGGDLASCLGWLAPEQNAKAARRLLLEEPADLPGGRRSLYVCPECAELACGALTVVVERAGGGFVWRDFGFQSDEVVRREGLEAVGPFVFDRAEYERAILVALRNEELKPG